MPRARHHLRRLPRALPGLALLLALVASVAPPAHAAAPRSLVATTTAEPTGPRAMRVAWTVAPGGRPVAFHVLYRRAGGAWMHTPRRPVGSRRRVITAEVTGLRPGSVYRVRVVATACAGCRGGTARGPERRVATPRERPPAPPAPEITPAPAPATAPQAIAASPPPALPPAPAESPAPVATPTSTPSPSPTATPAPKPAVPVPADLPDGAYRNPLSPLAEFPDPTLIRVGSSFFAYATGNRFQVMRSPDLVHWTRLSRAMATRPAWAVTEPDWHPWAPSVVPTDAPCPGASSGGCYLLFSVALSEAFGDAKTNCVGVATSPTPEGPFTDRGPLDRADGVREAAWPVGCGDAAGHGNIDPQPFVDEDGRAWLYVSTDWRCAPGCELRPEISVIPLEPDLLHAAGPRQPLLAGAAGTWEVAPWAPVVENPWIVKREGVYHLLYSGGSWLGHYAMGHATATSPTGPFVRSAPDPWTGSDATVLSMGGGMALRDGAGAEWFAYHGRDGNLTAPRTLRIDPLTWTAAGRPQLDGPSTAVRPAPVPAVTPAPTPTAVSPGG